MHFYDGSSMVDLVIFVCSWHEIFNRVVFLIPINMTNYNSGLDDVWAIVKQGDYSMLGEPPFTSITIMRLQMLTNVLSLLWIKLFDRDDSISVGVYKPSLAYLGISRPSLFGQPALSTEI